MLYANYYKALLSTHRIAPASFRLPRLASHFLVILTALSFNPFSLSANEHRPEITFRPLNRSEGQAIVEAISDHRQTLHSRRGKPDCSHLVNDLYNYAGFPYSYAKSTDLYRGHENFLRVSAPQPGDLIVWRGHVGLVVDPRQHLFYSSLRSGLETEDYTSPYWRRHGAARFFRYRTFQKDPYLTASDNDRENRSEGAFRTLPVSQSVRQDSRQPSRAEFAQESTQDFAGDDSATTLSESSPRARNAVLRQTSSPSETNLRAPSGILVIAAKDKPTVDQVAEAISELHQSFSADLNADALLRSRSPVIFFNRFQVDRVECKGKRGWAYIVIDSEASLAGGTLEKAVRHEEQHWEMRKGKSGWTVVVPAGDIYVPRAAAVRIFAQQLARLTDGNESLAAASMDSQESHLASLLNGLLNN